MQDYRKKSIAVLDQLVPILGAFAGGGLFALLGLPAPWVSGSMIGAMATALIRPLPEMNPALRDLSFLLAGASMGAGVTPETVALMAKVPMSFVMLALCMIVTVWLSSGWLIRMQGWRRDDAILAASPGALSSALAIALARGGDVTGVAIVQTVRLFVLVAILPGVIGWIEGRGGASAPMGTAMDAGGLAIMLGGGLLLGLALLKLGLAAPLLVGAALFGAFVHGAGWLDGVMPTPLAILGFVLIGAMIATRTRGITIAALRNLLAASMICLLIAVVVATAFAFLTAWLIDVRPGAALLAFAPGGLEAMTLLSIALALEPLYVGAHHIARFMAIGAALPFVFRVMDLRRAKVDD